MGLLTIFQKNKATKHYNEIIDLNKIHSYREYLVKLVTNGFKIKNTDNFDKYPFLILEYQNYEHIVSLFSLKPYFYDLVTSVTKTETKTTLFKPYFRPLTVEDNVNLGDIFYQIHGKNQTICDFYKVTKVPNGKYKSIKVNKLDIKVLSYDETTNNLLVEPGEISFDKKFTLCKFNEGIRLYRKDNSYKYELLEGVNYSGLLKKYNNIPKLMNYKKRIGSNEVNSIS